MNREVPALAMMPNMRIDSISSVESQCNEKLPANGTLSLTFSWKHDVFFGDRFVFRKYSSIVLCFRWTFQRLTFNPKFFVHYYCFPSLRDKEVNLICANNSWKQYGPHRTQREFHEKFIDTECILWICFHATWHTISCHCCPMYSNISSTAAGVHTDWNSEMLHMSEQVHLRTYKTNNANIFGHQFLTNTKVNVNEYVFDFTVQEILFAISMPNKFDLCVSLVSA